MKIKTILICFLCIYAANTILSQTLGLLQNDSLSVNGYTLFTNNRTTYLIDNCGFIVNQWESDYFSNTSNYLLENGNLLRTCRVGGTFSGGGIGGRIELFNWEGDLLWWHHYATTEYHQHHDIEPLPNGNILILAWDLRTAEDAVEAGRIPVSLSADGIWPERIVEVEMVGTNEINVVWEWYVWDHLVQDSDSTKNNFGVVAEHPELIDINYGILNGPFPGGLKDWIHANAIDYHPELDQIAISSRHFNEIWIIDHSTTTAEAAGHSGGRWGKGGDLLYRWGNPQVYDRGNEDDQTLFGQHNINWILEENHPYHGKLLVYNNGGGRPAGNYSSVDIFEPPTDADGNYLIDDNLAFGPEQLDWTFTEPGFYSANISGAHALPGGNIMVCEGSSGRLFEVTLDGQVVWEYINPVSNVNGPLSQGQPPTQNATFRATRYPTDYEAFVGRDLTPGLPVELNPTPSDCIIYNGEPVALHAEPNQLRARALQNPVQNEVTVVNETGKPIVVEVFSPQGILMGRASSPGERITLPCSTWPAGMYMLHLASEDRSSFATRKLIKTD